MASLLFYPDYKSFIHSTTALDGIDVNTAFWQTVYFGKPVFSFT